MKLTRTFVKKKIKRPMHVYIYTYMTSQMDSRHNNELLPECAFYQAVSARQSSNF